MSNLYSPPEASLELESSEENTSGQGKDAILPDGVKGWSWGALLLNWIWAISNKTWIGLLAFIPYIGFIVAIILGVNGREWAWRNKKWDDLEHFNRVQKRWSKWGVGLLIIPFIIGILAAILLPFLASASNN